MAVDRLRMSQATWLKKSPDGFYAPGDLAILIGRVYFLGEAAGLAASFLAPFPAFTSTSVADMV
jgi:hypothetical protein